MASLTALLLLVVGAAVPVTIPATVPATVPADAPFPGATQVYATTFDAATEEELNGWPPGWTRRQGPGFPRYVRMKLDECAPPGGGRCLRVDLNGGGAMAYSPLVPVKTDVEYVLEGCIQTLGLKYDRAYLSLAFLDSKRNELATVPSKKIATSDGWQRLRVGPIRPPAGASSCTVGLHVEPAGRIEDIHGSAMFGNLWVGRLPRIVLTARSASASRAEAKSDISALQSAAAVFTRGEAIEISCDGTGFIADSFELRLRLENREGRLLAEHKQRFKGPEVAIAREAAPLRLNPQSPIPSPPEAATSSHDSHLPSPPAPLANAGEGSASASVVWKPPLDEVGFYRVRATVASTDNSSRNKSIQAESTLVVVEPQSAPHNSEFGWSLSPINMPLQLVPLSDLICCSGIRTVKYPFAGKPSIEPLIGFCDRLNRSDIGLIVVLRPDPVPSEKPIWPHDLLAAEAFARDAKVWYPSVEPVLARLGTQIRSWQLGDDLDLGWVGCRELSEIVSHVKGELDHVGQNLDVAIPWGFNAPLPYRVQPENSSGLRRDKTPSVKPVPWRFLTSVCDSSVSEKELAMRLDGSRSADIARWIALEALPQAENLPDARVAHLAGRMIAAKIHGAEGIYFADPFEPQRGLIHPDRTPTDLFLPWRTTALMLGGANYIGEIDLPRGDSIHCFTRDGKNLAVVPASSPTTETIYLGPDVRQHDLWGRHQPCPAVTCGAGVSPASVAAVETPAPQLQIAIDGLPTFLTGLDPTISNWHLAVHLSPDRVPSIPNTASPVSLEFKNTFAKSIAGRVKITGPQRWQVKSQSIEFRLAPGATWKRGLEIVLPNDVVAGRQMVRFDFEIDADQTYCFAVHRPLEVSLGDMLVEAKTHLNDHGDLEVHQTILNRGKKPASFRCDLLTPDRRRQSVEVRAVPSTLKETVYLLPDGEELFGKTLWLRAEEINGPRVLNFRLETPSPADAKNRRTQKVERSADSITL